MKKVVGLLFTLLFVLCLATPALTSGVSANAASGKNGEEGGKHDLPSQLSDKQRALRQHGFEKVLKGQASGKGDNKVVEVAKGQYVELAREGEDSILTVLGEFGDLKHNQIPQPDRTVDNNTIWAPDFSQAYFQDLLFSEAPGAVSMRNYYIEQSSNRYTVNGDVTPWATAPLEASYYGSNYCGDIVCERTWLFVRDSVNAWAATMSPTELNDYLSRFDVWDRYDYDSDGNFDEPDGYIDHFQSVHAGVGEETGGGVLGENAIWSHRWYVQLTPIGAGGPTVGGQVVPFGGTRIGNSNYWIGDYTAEPENGGVGVFAHEFGHDLGLPDLYDTSGNTGGAVNSTGFWTLMSFGSYGSRGRPEEGIGTAPTHMGAWEKFQLGWLNYEVAFAGQKSEHKIGPAEVNTKQAQGLFVLLPDRVVNVDIGTAFEGSQFYYSGAGNDLDHTITKSVTLPAAPVSLTAQVRYDIEKDWDYAYLTVNGNPVTTNLSTNTNPHGQNFGNGITGSSDSAWVALTANLSAYAGQTVTLGFRYWTDGAAVGTGFAVDLIAINGTVIGTAESDEGWVYDGFTTTDGASTESYFNAYVAENRQYIGFDRSLQTVPRFGFENTRPEWVEYIPYQDGLLISYWNSQYSDNNVGDHPGEGLILPVDAHPQFSHYNDNALVGTNTLTYDSTFGLEATDKITTHRNTTEVITIGPKPAVPVFDDRNTYWFDSDEHGATGSHPGSYQPGWYSVDVPNTGTQIRVQSQNTKGGFMQVQVSAAK